MREKEKVIITEHVFEVRHVASGTFLDIRGNIADYIRDAKIFPHWNIGRNTVQFRDKEDKAETDAGFVGYKSAGYIVFNAPTRNYFQDKAVKFWKVVNENKHYKIPELLRVGIRTKAFFPLSKTFEVIRSSIYEKFFTKEAQTLIGGNLDDLQLVVDYIEQGFKVFLRGGPIKKEEANKFFNFEEKEFENNGLFLDLDFFKTKDISHTSVEMLIPNVMNITWKKLETIARELKF